MINSFFKKNWSDIIFCSFMFINRELSGTFQQLSRSRALPTTASSQRSSGTSLWPRSGATGRSSTTRDLGRRWIKPTNSPSPPLTLSTMSECPALNAQYRGVQRSTDTDSASYSSPLGQSLPVSRSVVTPRDRQIFHYTVTTTLLDMTFTLLTLT